VSRRLHILAAAGILVTGCAEPAVIITVQARPVVGPVAALEVSVVDAALGVGKSTFRLGARPLPATFAIAGGSADGPLDVTVIATGPQGQIVGEGRVRTDGAADAQLWLEFPEISVAESPGEPLFLSDDATYAGRQAAALPDGSIAVLWTGRSNLLVRRYDPAGRPVGLTTGQAGDAQLLAENPSPRATIACASSVCPVLWEQPAAGLGVLFVPVGESRVPRPPTSLGSATRARFPVVVARSDGFVLAWREEDPAGETRVLSQQVDGEGVPLGPVQSMDVASTPLAPASVIDGAGLTLGGHVLVWAGKSALAYQLFAAATPVPPQQIQLRTGSEVTAVRVTALEGGGFAIAWLAVEPGGLRQPSLLLFDRRGLPLAPQVEIAEPGPDHLPVALAGRADGGLCASWIRDAGLNGSAVYLRCYDAAGVALGEPVRLNQAPVASFAPSVVPFGKQAVAVVWAEEPGLKGAGAIRARIVYEPVALPGR
jgi:hypothetical protein